MADQEPEWAHFAEFWKNTLAGVSITFAILPTIMFCLRVYASHLVSSRVRADDILMGVAVLLMWGNTASVLLKAFNGIGVPSSELPPEKARLLSLGSWLIVKFWATSMMCVKVSIILFLKHVIGTSTRIRMWLNVLAAVCVGWACVPFFYTIFFCRPVSYYWDKSIEGGWCIDNDLYIKESIAAGVLSLVTDLIILVFPMPTIWGLKLRLKKKIAVTAILCVGGVVCVFSLLRCVQFAYFDTANLSTSSNLQSLWTILENDVSIICGCMPQLQPLFTRYFGDSRAENSSGGYIHSYAQQQSRTGNTAYDQHSGVRTRVSGTTNEYMSRAGRAVDHETRNSSEIELKGIQVQTTIKRESMVGSTEGMSNEEDSRSSTSVTAVTVAK